MHRRIAAALAAIGALACAGRRPAAPTPAAPAPPAASAEAAADRDEPPPVLRLPRDVRPLRYALELEVVPARDEGLRGRATIEVELDLARQTLWLDGKDLRVAEVSVEPEGGAPVAARWTQVAPVGVARLDLERPVGPGRARIRLAWEAPWAEVLGAFRSRSQDGVFVATQFEPNGARQAFPGFDEPGFKTPFEVTLVVPDDQVAVSNAPEAERAVAGPGLRRVRFAPTRPLPTYLVFWAVGPFDVVQIDAPPNAVRATALPVRLVVPRGHAGDTAVAREASAAMLDALEAYFGTPFPYDKLDHVAVPGGFGGAMENAGAILYAQRYLLADPATSREIDRRTIAIVLAHELAHQWFGDLVTPAWWTDIWLNESFADWMGFRAVARWRPAWRIDLAFLRDAQAAFDDDVLASARPIRKPLARLEDVQEQFDAISYEKGGMLLAMVERFAGEERFRDGVRRYLAAHAHGTGSTPELVAELSRAAGRDLAPTFDGFLEKPGYPLVEAKPTCDAGRGRVLLSQRRYVPLGAAPGGDARWTVPVCARYAARGGARERCVLLDAATGALELPEGCPDWLFPNAGGVGYYRWTLPPQELARLRERGLARLTSPERLAYAQGLAAAQRAGAVPYADAMASLAALARDPENDVSAEPRRALALAHDHLVAPGVRPAVEQVARWLFRPELDRIGWSARRGEAPDAGQRRGELAAFLAWTGRDPEVRRRLARLGRAYAGVADGRLHVEAVDPDLAHTAVAVAVEDGGAPVFDAAVARLREARDPTARLNLATALSATSDPALWRRYLALLTDGTLRTDERIRSLRARVDPAKPDRVLAALETDPAAALAWLPAPSNTRLPLVTATLCRARDAARVRAVFEPMLAQTPGLREPLAHALEAIALCAAEREASGAAATAWFEAAARR